MPHRGILSLTTPRGPAIHYSKRRASCSRINREPASLSSARKPGGRFSHTKVTSVPPDTFSNVAVSANHPSAICRDMSSNGSILYQGVVHRHAGNEQPQRIFRWLQMIDDATSDQDLRVPPSNHFEKLRGNLAGFHSIRVNNQWRLVFRWDCNRGEAEGVYIDDHSYR